MSSAMESICSPRAYSLLLNSDLLLTESTGLELLLGIQHESRAL